MLKITIPAREYNEIWDEEKEEFIPVPIQKEQIIQLEHSLISLSKWESKWCKPFFSKKPKSEEEKIDYIRCMTLTSNVDPNVYNRITKENIEEINNYIESPMTATVVCDTSNKKNNKIVTSELIYYWMIALNIPFECQKWHINRLLMLIRVCNAENAPAKKMSRKDSASYYAALNAARRKKFNSKG